MRTRHDLVKMLVLYDTAIGMCCLHPVNAQGQESAPVVLVGATPVNVPCGKEPGNPRIGDCYEVLSDSLMKIPLIVEIGIGTDSERGVPLRKEGRRWYELIELFAEGQPPSEITVNIMGRSERYLNRGPLDVMYERQPDGVAVARMVEDVPPVLTKAGGVSVLATVSGPNNEPLEPGIYKFRGRVRPRADAAFLDSQVEFTIDFSIRVRKLTDESENTEHELQRYYLWGTALKQRGMPEGEEVLKKGTELVKDYINKGAGDTEEVYNLTPRYQAAQFLMRLGRKREAITYFQRAYSQGVAAKACRWQPYIFQPNPDGSSEGPMPQYVKDDIYSILQRLYMEEYGRRLEGVPKPSEGER